MLRCLADVRSNGGFTETSPFVGISDSGLGDLSGPVGTHGHLLETMFTCAVTLCMQLGFAMLL